MKKQIVAALAACVALVVGLCCLSMGNRMAAAPAIAASITAAISLTLSEKQK